MTSSAALELSIGSRHALYQAWMPLVRNGGVFVPTERRHELGDAVSLKLALFDSDEPVTVTGRVVWVTPGRAQGKRVAGVGVQFRLPQSDRARIEELLAGASGGDGPTHTL